MKTNDISKALCGRVEDAAILLAYFPNVKATAELKDATSYLDVTFAARRTQGSGLDVTEVVQEIGIFQVVVVVPDGGGVTVAENYSTDIAKLFTQSPVLNLPIAGGNIIIGTVDIMPGFNVDGEYRVPVQIPYIANQTM